MAGEFTALGSMAGPEGALVGGAIDFGVSLWNNHKQQKMQKEQLKIQQQKLQLSEQQMLAQQQRVQEWNEKYGSIEHNMLKYVKGLDAANVYSQVDGKVSRQFENARKNMEAHLASRGFDVAGGVTVDAFQNLAAMEADAKVKYQQLAEQQVLQQQQSVLSGHPQPGVPSNAEQISLLGQQQQLLGMQQRDSQNSLNDIATQFGDLLGAKAKWKQRQLDNRYKQSYVQNNPVQATSPTAKEVQ